MINIKNPQSIIKGVWPNRVSIARSSLYDWWKYYSKVMELKKWCLDTLSSEEVLWLCIAERDSTHNEYFSFYFAQPHDAMLFKLVNCT